MFQFPFKCSYTISQGYSDNANGIYNGPLDGGHHGALDIVPNPVFPAEIYPLANGSELSIQDTDPLRGKGVRERIILDQPTIDYFQSLNVIPYTLPNNQIVCLDILYWHMLDVTDKDGTLTQDTPIGHAGNTGSVYHLGEKVPDNQKGVPPYPGLHLHLETRFGTTQGVIFNLDKDPQGRVDPLIILKQGDLMNQAVVVKSKVSPTVYVCYKIPDMDYLQKKANLEGITLPPVFPDTDSLK